MIDLDELERRCNRDGQLRLTVAVPQLKELIALARKGQQYDEHMRDYYSIEAAGALWKERAEVYERALRFYADKENYSRITRGSTEIHRDWGERAREALEKGE